MDNEKMFSIFELKQYLLYFLSVEFDLDNFKISIKFESTLKRRLFVITFEEQENISVCINLSVVRKCFSFLPTKMILKICSLYIANYIKLLDISKKNIPQSYFDGLVFLNAVEIINSKSKVEVFLPSFITGEEFWWKRTIRPIEIKSLLISLISIKVLGLSDLSKYQKDEIELLNDIMVLFTGLPEIEYNNSKNPSFALISSLKSINELVEKNPNVVQNFPVINMLKLEIYKNLDEETFIKYCLSTNNNFMIGIAVRLIGFINSYHNYDLKENQIRLNEAVERYIEYSLYFYKESQTKITPIIRENLYAIKTMMKSLNRYLKTVELEINSGNIHPIG